MAFTLEVLVLSVIVYWLLHKEFRRLERVARTAQIIQAMKLTTLQVARLNLTLKQVGMSAREAAEAFERFGRTWRAL